MESNRIIHRPLPPYSEPEFTDVREAADRGYKRVAYARMDGRACLLKGLTDRYRHDIDYIDLLMEEYDKLSGLDHPGIPSVITFAEKSPIGPCIVEEAFEGVSLTRFLDRYPSLQARRMVARQMTLSLAHLHSRGLTHGNLRPDNVRVAPIDDRPWLVDFAFDDNPTFRRWRDSLPADEFTPPELRPDGKVDIAGDIYAYGQILKRLKVGRRYNWIIGRCCRRNPERRFRDATVLVEIYRHSRLTRRYRLWAALAIAMAAILLIIVMAPR